jgi:hypothetical protein
MTSTTTIQLRHDTAANWTTENPTLATGEMGVETDTQKFKFGDGSTAWTSLSYAATGATFKYGLYTLSANQSSNLAVGNHIEFNTSKGSLGGLSTGSGQANGIITLPAGKTYKITGVARFNHSSTNYTGFGVYDRTNSAYLQPVLNGVAMDMNYNSAQTDQPTFIAVVEPTTNIDIDVRFVDGANTSLVWACFTWLLIEEYGGY